MIKARAVRGRQQRRRSDFSRACGRSSGASIWISPRIDDIHSIKRQIHAFAAMSEIAVDGHNIKLGRGGIREIEFFVQTQQLITGGRHAGLRGAPDPATRCESLADGGWITAAGARRTDARLRFLRRVEHRLQMVDDEQTHTLPEDREGVVRIAHCCGYRAGGVRAATAGHLDTVQAHYAQLFEAAPRCRETRQLVFTGGDDDPRRCAASGRRSATSSRRGGRRRCPRLAYGRLPRDPQRRAREVG